MGRHTAQEVNFDGLVGPTHNYAGLAQDNLAATRNKEQVSQPKAAALEGLRKMRYIAGLGVGQAILPPHERPALGVIRRLGFSGSDREILEKAYAADRRLLAACYSASSMWAANAATVSPGADAEDKRTHITLANLVSQFHRSIEPRETTRVFRALFGAVSNVVLHDPLPAIWHLGDEGAANHTRLCMEYGASGVEVFTYGRSAFDAGLSAPTRYQARQTLEACQAIARRHRLRSEATVFIQQNPNAVDAGAFHNDVLCVGNKNVLLYYAGAFADGPGALGAVREAFAATCGGELKLVSVSPDHLRIQDAVESYLFNSQLLSLPEGAMDLVAPIEVRDNPRARAVVEAITDAAGTTPIRRVHYIDVRQSMRNGGGPACLRLRVVLSSEELAAVHQGCFLTERLFSRLCEYVEKNYRDKLAPDDLRDPQLIEESRTALDELTSIIGVGSIYDFQRWGAGTTQGS